jgi:hypothetical protein
MNEAVMEGTIAVPQDKTEQMYKELLEVEKTVSSLGPEAQKWFAEANCLQWENIKTAFEGVKKAMELGKQFRRVERDDAVTREVKNGNGIKVEVPLVFHAKLPLARKIEFNRSVGANRYKFSTKMPNPTPEAIAALRQHSGKFDHTELWWVPNEILVEKLPDPDPMLVGAIKIGEKKHLYFELHRWIDESVEATYWAKEGY